MSTFSFFLFTLIFQGLPLSTTAYEGEGSSVSLEHCIEPLDGVEECTFRHRGDIFIRSMKEGVATYVDSDPVDADLFYHPKIRDANYRVRVAVRSLSNSDHSSEGAVDAKYVHAFLPACLMLEAALSDFLTLHCSPSSQIISLSLRVGPSYCSRTSLSQMPDNFNTTVAVFSTVPGPAPDAQTFLEMKEREERAKGTNQDNRSFFAKYWMYIIPGVLLFMMMSSQQDPGAGGNGGGGR